MRPFSRTVLAGTLGPSAGILGLLALVAIFLSTPLVRFGEVHFSSADLFQDFTLTRVAPGHLPGNRLLSDSVTQMQPWTMFAREEIAAGRAPLWNPRCGGGAPLLGNYQSAVFSPFTLPFYTASFKTALLVSACLKLCALGLFTFLFLRQIRLAVLPSLLGAVAFTFTGHNALLLTYPHVGAIVALPAGLLFAEKALQRFETVALSLPGERRAQARVLGPLVGLTISLLAGLLAGHPESFFFALLFVSAWCIARSTRIAFRVRAEGRPLRGFGLFAGKLVFAGSLAAGLAAFQLLPFLEYLGESVVLEQRIHGQTPLDPRFWPLALFPDALGNPASPAFLAYDVPSPNYETVNLAYVGGTVLFLALFAVVHVRRDRRIGFFLLLGLAWVVYAYDLFGLSALVTWIPGLAQAPMNRSQAIGSFSACCAAALAVDHVLRRESLPHFGRAILVALAGLGFLVLFRFGAQGLLDEFASRPSPNRAAFDAFVPSHLRWISQTFAAGIVALCLLLVARGTKLRALGGSTLVLVAFLQTGWQFKDYNPVCEDRLFFPATPSIRALRETVGTDRVAILGEDGIPPESNLAYGIAIPQAYDGMWVRRFDSLYRDRFGETHNWRSILRGPELALRTFGIPWVLAKWSWIFLGSGPTIPPGSGPRSFLPVEIAPGHPVTQTFRCDTDRLQAVQVVAGVFPATNPCTLLLRLEDAGTGELVLERSVTSREIAADVYSDHHVRGMLDPDLVPLGRPIVLSFEPLQRSRGHVYAITLSCEDGASGDTVTVWHASRRSYAGGESRVGDRSLPGEILFAWSCNQDQFELVRRIGDYGLFRYRRTLGKYWTVRAAVAARNDLEALDFVRSPSFDPARLVVLSPEAGGEPPTDSTAAREVRRLVQAEGSSTIHLVCPDGRSIVPIEDEITFLANRWAWSEVESIPKEDMAEFEVVSTRRALELGARLLEIDQPAIDARLPKMIEETPMWIRLEASCEEPELLVIAQSHYPGWKARVNGVERPVHRANYAFSAVELRRGLNIVDFSYEPESFRIGLWIGIASLLAGVLCLLPRGERS